jgi:hypothetical protein
MSERLERLLREENISARIEARERLVVLIPHRAWQGGAGERARIIDMARAAGFSHVAVEIDPPDAPLSGD